MRRTRSQNAGPRLLRAADARHQRRGIVLVVVLVLVSMVALAGFGFLAEMTTEYRATKINGDLLQAQQTLASAETLLLSVADHSTQASSADEENIATLQDNPKLFQSRVVRGVRRSAERSETMTDGTGSADSWRFSIVHELPLLSDQPDTTAESLEARDVEQASPLQFGVRNESSKLNLLTVRQWEEQQAGEGRRALMQIPGMTTVAADSILDWIDEDDVPREFGAEAAFYRQRDTPWQPRNDLPATVEELLFVKGVIRDVFYGTSRMDASESSVDGARQTRWTDYLTVHSAERNVSQTGQQRLFVNGGDASSLEALESELKSILPEPLARYIRLARLHGISFSEQAGIPPLSAALTPSQDGVIYELTNLADLLDSAVQLPSEAGGQIVVSPLSASDPESIQLFRLMEDLLTTSEASVLPARISINSASEAVLRTLPLDPTVVGQIVQQRETTNAAERQSTVWLLTNQIVDIDTYRSLYPDITAAGDVHAGEIVVYRITGGPFLRRKIIIDAANQPARRVSWHDLTEHGFPIPIRQLESRSGLR